ncbi:hypothetical protein [Metabacillus fastidiosus]
MRQAKASLEIEGFTVRKEHDQLVRYSGNLRRRNISDYVGSYFKWII